MNTTPPKNDEAAWLICWRVPAVPQNLKTFGGADAPLRFGRSPSVEDSVFYACVRTGLAQEAWAGTQIGTILTPSCL